MVVDIIVIVLSWTSLVSPKVANTFFLKAAADYYIFAQSSQVKLFLFYHMK